MDTWYLLVLRCYNSQLWVEEDGMPLFVDGMPIIIEKVCSGDNAVSYTHLTLPTIYSV